MIKYPITAESLDEHETPAVISPGRGIICIVDENNTTIDVTYRQARELIEKLKGWVG